MTVIFSRGQEFQAEIIEISYDNILICNLNGKLYRVLNQSDRLFQVGNKVKLVVISVFPLELKLVTKSKLSMDRFI